MRRKLYMLVLTMAILLPALPVYATEEDGIAVETSEEEITEGSEEVDEELEEDTAESEQALDESESETTDPSYKKFTLSMPIPEDAPVSGSIYILYTGDETDVFLELNEENDYVASIELPAGEYRLFQVETTTTDLPYQYETPDAVTVKDDTESFVYIYDNEAKEYINSDLIGGEIPKNLASEGLNNIRNEEVEDVEPPVAENPTNLAPEEPENHPRLPAIGSNTIFFGIIALILIIALVIALIRFLMKRRAMAIDGEVEEEIEEESPEEPAPATVAEDITPEGTDVYEQEGAEEIVSEEYYENGEEGYYEETEDGEVVYYEPAEDGTISPTDYQGGDIEYGEAYEEGVVYENDVVYEDPEAVYEEETGELIEEGEYIAEDQTEDEEEGPVLF